MQENLGEIRRGRDAAVAREKMTLSLFQEVRTTLVPPLFVAGDHVVLHWIFEFVRADGAVVRIEELAQQRWAGNKMAEERFYYDPAQMAAMRGLQRLRSFKTSSAPRAPRLRVTKKFSRGDAKTRSPEIASAK